MNIARILKITIVAIIVATFVYIGGIASATVASAAPVKRCQPVTVPDGASYSGHRSPLGRWSVGGRFVAWSVEEDGRTYSTAPCAVRSALVCWVACRGLRKGKNCRTRWSVKRPSRGASLRCSTGRSRRMSSSKRPWRSSSSSKPHNSNSSNR